MKQTKSTAMKTAKLLSPDNQPRQLCGDLVLEIHNQRLTMYDVRNFLSVLGTLDTWGFIVPRLALSAMTIPYEFSEMDYDSMLSEPNSAQAVLVYRGWDAVMIKPPEISNVILQ